MSNRRVTVIILCWNRWDLTQRCLSTIRTHTDLARAEILVVDNGSTDATPRELKRYDWLRVLRNDRNLGFVRGNNVGIAASDRATDVILLNNDIEITQSDWIDRLQATAHAAPDVGVVGCVGQAGAQVSGDWRTWWHCKPERVPVHAIHAELVVQVRAGCQTRHAHVTQKVTLVDSLPSV